MDERVSSGTSAGRARRLGRSGLPGPRRRPDRSGLQGSLGFWGRSGHLNRPGRPNGAEPVRRRVWLSASRLALRGVLGGGGLLVLASIACTDRPGKEPNAQPADQAAAQPPDGADGRADRTGEPEHDPAAAESLVAVGARLRREGRVEEAQDILSRATRLDPANTAALFELGSVHLERGEPELAIALYNEAARRGPASPSLMLHLGRAHLRLGNRAAARAAWRLGLESGASGPEADLIRSSLEELEEGR